MEDELMDELMEDFEAHPTPQADTAEPDSVAEGSKTGEQDIQACSEFGWTLF